MAIAPTISGTQDNSVQSTNNKNGANNSDTSDALNKSFLTLLVAQLKNQDPTNPMKNNELTSQLAQINTVSGIEKLNTTLGALSGQLNGSQSIQASSLIGHGVMVPGKEILVGSEEGKVSTTPFGIELERAADKVTATISDAAGNVVRTIELGKLSAGVHSFTWDGTLADSTNVPDGAYTVAITAKNGNEPQVAPALRFAMVNAVTRGSDGAKLDLGMAGTATLDDVRLIMPKLGAAK